MLPILYKLFARLILARIRPTLENEQNVDQAGFRSGFSCDDHLQSIVLLTEGLSEFNLPFWVCAVDFAKAFDSVEHSALWNALLNQGVSPRYIKLLAHLYKGQVGHISSEVLSRGFRIERGTKQGDPMSPALFNAVLEEVMRECQTGWRRKGWGVHVGDSLERRLTNLRFADDLLLLAASRAQVKHMLQDLINAAQKAGLEIHLGKTKVLSNEVGQGLQSLQFSAGKVDILPLSGSTDYLGRRLCLGSLHDSEIDSRLEKAWKKFFLWKAELCGKHVSIAARLKLFSAVVTPTFLYGSGTWTLTAGRENRIRTTQRRMLRWILGAGRRLIPTTPCKALDTSLESESSSSSSGGINTEPEEIENEASTNHEDWVDWIRRTTHLAEEHCQRAGLEDWVAAVRRKHWRWAGHLARRTDGRWSSQLLSWVPLGRRSRGHPCKRWSDALDEYFFKTVGLPRGSWQVVAMDRLQWHSLEDDFVKA